MVCLSYCWNMTASILHRCFVGALVAAAACGDSDPTGSTGPGGASTTASTTQAGPATSTSTTGGTSSSGGGGEGGAGGRGEGGEGGGGGIAPACDGDGDGALLFGPGCCGSVGRCDCDDNDANVFPGQTMSFSVPRSSAPPGSEFDYDCDGVEEKLYPNDSDGCGLLNCAASPAFTGDGGDYYCGAPGGIITCNALQCQVQTGQFLPCQ
jgi:hypothetical protein